jgi:hypothetical protein
VGYVKAMVYALKVNKSANYFMDSQSCKMHKTALFQKVTHALATLVRKCVQADGGHIKLILA